MHQIICRLLRPRLHWGSLHLTALPQTSSWFRGWGPRGKGRREGMGKGGGKERRGGEGRESRNAPIQSWQAYLLDSYFVPG